jgi:hypothetical protein
VKKKDDCSQGYFREENLEPQLREIVYKCGLSPAWQEGMMKMWHTDSLKAKEHVSSELRSLTISLEAVDKNLNRLLELYLEEVIDTDAYQSKKRTTASEEIPT